MKEIVKHKGKDHYKITSMPKSGKPVVTYEPVGDMMDVTPVVELNEEMEIVAIDGVPEDLSVGKILKIPEKKTTTYDSQDKRKRWAVPEELHEKYKDKWTKEYGERGMVRLLEKLTSFFDQI